MSEKKGNTVKLKFPFPEHLCCEVFSPKKLKTSNFDKIIITSRAFSKDIRKSILNLGIPPKKIIEL